MSTKRYMNPRAEDMDNSRADGITVAVIPPGRKFFAAPRAQEIHFYLSGEIGDPEEYTDWFHIIRTAGEEDLITIHINSGGGDLSTAIQFMRALKESSAIIVTSAEGYCMSAATLIFLCGDNVEISEHSMFMFHNYSGGIMGKGGEMYDSIAHEKRWSESLWRAEYKDFLTEPEIESMLAGKDIWMDGDEVLRRLNKKSKALQKEIKKKKIKELPEQTGK